MLKSFPSRATFYNATLISLALALGAVAIFFTVRMMHVGPASCTLDCIATSTASRAVPEMSTQTLNLLPSSSVPVEPKRVLDVQTTPATGKETGAWIWDSPKQMTATLSERLLQDAAKSGFTAVYVTVDDYVAIAAMPAGAAKDSAKLAYFQALYSFISYAKALGLTVDAEGGWRDWAQTSNRWKGYALIDMAKEYNQKYPDSKISRLQYDVEPYLLSTYEKNKAVTLNQFVEFIDESASRMKAVDAGFSVVIPHFYDSAQKWTPSFEYGGKTTHAFTHVLDALEKKPGSTVIIMAYRDFVEGGNGSYEISAAEMKEASAGGYATKVVVALETGKVTPAYTTYFGASKQDVLDASGSLRDAFGTQPAFGGISVHYLDTYLQLK